MPPIDHVLYIPAILILGAYIGFRLGVLGARRELERREAHRKE